MRDFIELTQGPIDLGEVYAAVVDPSCGGVCVFVGTTRDLHDGRPVAELSYEAYVEMAQKELEGLAKKLREDHPAVVKLCLTHRLGVVPLAEASVAWPQRSTSIFGVNQRSS